MKLISIAALILAASCQSAFAQATTAGGQFQQIPVAPQAPHAEPDFKVAPRAVAPDADPAGASITVTALHITGQTRYSEQALIAVGGFTPGSALTLSQLRAIAAKIAAFYNAHGYFLAQAYLPAQDIKGGQVAIAVIEGQYGKIALDNHSRLVPSVANRVLSGLNEGDVVESAKLERRLLLLSDLPGVRVKSTLAPGTAIGSSDLIVGLTPAPLVSGSVEVDNAGNRYTGAYRFGGTLNLNDPTGLGDLLSLRILASTGGLVYGRAAYQVPIGNLTLGVAYSHIGYQLGREFKSLDADGIADVASLYASYPLVRTRDANLYAVAGFDAKKYEDRVHLTDTQSDRKSHVVTGGFNADERDGFAGGGSTTTAVTWSYGKLDIETPVDRALDATTAHTQGHFNKVAFSAARLQTITGPLSLYGAVRGQVALNNLDSSEKMELGGAYGVRAYPEGESYGDQGYVATAEARLALQRWTKHIPGQFQVIGFVDVGQVAYAKTPWFTGPNVAHRSGVGAGVTWSGPERILISATYAHKLGGEQATSAPDEPGRAWFQVVKLF